MRIYLIDYVESKARIMSVEAVDKGTNWSCDVKTLRMELGETFFVVLDITRKGPRVFTSLREACDALTVRITREIEAKTEEVRRLYVELEKTQQCGKTDADGRVRDLCADAEHATLCENPSGISGDDGGEEDGEEDRGWQDVNLHPSEQNGAEAS
jgi:hypothetical protein